MPYHGSFRSNNYTWLKVFLLVFVPLWFVNEHFIYWMQSWRWPTMPNIDRDVKSRQVIMLVADPQLVGYQDEPRFPVGTITRWDVHSYLRNTFSLAYSYCEPDVVVFLGDLIDEGSKATGSEYKDTYERFASIFELAKHSKAVYIPGDNDIGGGARGDLVTKEKVMRFQHYFGNVTDLINHGFIDYIKLHLIYQVKGVSNSNQHQQSAADEMKPKVSGIPVMVNHYPVLNNPKGDVSPITKRLGPKVIFSAHWHKSEIYTCEDCLADDDNSWTVQYHELEDIDSYIHLNLSSPHYMCEIAVPTCSYRMGVQDMGYGVAIIDSDKSMQYTVLWLPRRYTVLFGYLGALIIYVIVFAIRICSKSRRKLCETLVTILRVVYRTMLSIRRWRLCGKRLTPSNWWGFKRHPLTKLRKIGL